jgi:hypothetical protein
MESDKILGEIQERGFAILPGLLTKDQCTGIKEALEPYFALDHYGRNPFEGHRTQRVYTLVARGRLFEWMVDHPAVLSVIDRLLGENNLLTASQAIRIHPGEIAQDLHFDDSFYPIPRPRPAISDQRQYDLGDRSLYGRKWRHRDPAREPFVVG